MTEINFYITENLINDMDASDYEAFERAQDGDIKIYRLRPAMCRFMVDENNQPIPHAQALKISEKLKIRQLKDFVQKFFDVMKNSAVPKLNGSPLKSQSEVELADSLFQDGLQR